MTQTKDIGPQAIGGYFTYTHTVFSFLQGGLLKALLFLYPFTVVSVENKRFIKSARPLFGGGGLILADIKQIQPVAGSYAATGKTHRRLL